MITVYEVMANLQYALAILQFIICWGIVAMLFAVYRRACSLTRARNRSTPGGDPLALAEVAMRAARRRGFASGAAQS